MKFNKTSLIICFGLISLLMIPVSAHAAIPTSQSQPQFQDPLKIGSKPAEKVINDIIGRIIMLLVSIVAPLALLAIVLTGIRLTLSSLSGNEQGVAKAKQLLFWAVLGLLIVGVSALILLGIQYILGLTEISPLDL